MIELYSMISPNVQKIYIMLEECGLPYQLNTVDIWKGEQFSEDFRKLNPNAKVPIIVDHDAEDGEPMVIFESGAILFYLAEKTGRFLPTDLRDRHGVFQWLMVQVANIGPMFGQFNHFTKFADGHEYSLSRYTTQMEKLYRLLDDRLADHHYLGGDTYSIADIATYPWFRNQNANFGATVPFTKIGGAGYDNLWRWFDEVSKRPAVQKAMSLVDGVSSTFPTATKDEVDRVLGRGRYFYQGG